MKDEYIHKSDALNAISCDITITGKKNAEIVCKAIASFADGIKALPPADVAPVVHSEWIYHMSFGVCKKCGYEYEWKGTDAKNYCPNCGAKMDAQREE